MFHWIREHLANLLKEHCLMVGGDTNVTQWLKEEGINASLPSILKAGLSLFCMLIPLCCTQHCECMQACTLPHLQAPG